MKDLKKLWLMILAFLLVFVLVAEDMLLPIDENVIIGQLDNGLTYYIRHNSEPSNIAEFRLVLKVGSILEDDDQQGVAHFLEHMLFNGTENFPDNSVTEYLDTIGFGFMGGLNAYTSLDVTCYEFRSRTDDPEILDTIILMLSDFAARATLSSEMIEKERGIVLEEMRGSRGASERMSNQLYSVLFKDSKWHTRMPIGTQEVIESIPRQRVLDFYTDWYRPELQAIIAVGDFTDLDEIRDLIYKHFGSIPSTVNPREFPDLTIPSHSDTRISIITDPEAMHTQATITHKLPISNTETITEYRDYLIKELINTMLDNRLTDLTRQVDSPILWGWVFSMPLFNQVNINNFYAFINENQVLESFTLLFTEIERAKLYGFHNSELRRAKTSYLKNLEEAVLNKDNVPSEELIENYVEHFLYGGALLDIELEQEIVEFLLDTIDLDDITLALHEVFTDNNRVFSMTTSENNVVPLPTEEELLSIIEIVNNSNIEPYHVIEVEQPLMAKIPKRVKVKKPTLDNELDIYTWKLKNGATVHLKQTDFRNNEILLRAFRTGGESQADDDIIKSLWIVHTQIEESGAGNFSNTELDIYLDDKNVEFSAWLSSTTENISGNSSVANFETLMQMLWLTFNELRYDETAFEITKQKFELMYRNLENSPDFAMTNAFFNLLYNNNPRSGYPNTEKISQIDNQVAFDFFNSRFSDANDFTFIFVGNINNTELQWFIERYIATIPPANATKRNAVKADTSVIDHNIRFNQVSNRTVVQKGQDDRAAVDMVFANDFDFNQKEALLANGVGAVLTSMLFENVREIQSGVYHIYAHTMLKNDIVPEIALVVYFECNPENIDDIMNEAINQINLLINNEFDEKYLNNVKETYRQANEIDLRNNTFWINQLTSSVLNNTDFNEILNIQNIINNATREEIAEIAKKYIDIDKMLSVILIPE